MNWNELGFKELLDTLAVHGVIQLFPAGSFFVFLMSYLTIPLMPPFEEYWN